MAFQFPWRKKAAQHVVQPQPTQQHVHRALKLHSLRHGMWVMCKGRVGIVTGVTQLPAASYVNVMLVHPVDGTNDIQIAVEASWLRQATHDEIPEARRPHADHAHRMGYLVGKR